MRILNYGEVTVCGTLKAVMVWPLWPDPFVPYGIINWYNFQLILLHNQPFNRNYFKVLNAPSKEIHLHHPKLNVQKNVAICNVCTMYLYKMRRIYKYIYLG